MKLDQQIAERLKWAVNVAQEAGRLTLEYFQQAELAIELKQDDSPVTIADRRAEELLRGRIGQQFGSDAVLGEEFGESGGASEFRWILDPIDGTKSFIHGVPLYGTLVGIEYRAECVAGVIYLPALDECLFAAVDHGAWHIKGDQPPRATRVSRRAVLADSLLCTSDVASFAQTGRKTALDQLFARTRLVRTWGDCYGYYLVATGKADAMIDPVMAIWDAAALKPIIEEAGGAFTDWHGEATIASCEAIATNGLIHKEVLAAVGEGSA